MHHILGIPPDLAKIGYAPLIGTAAHGAIAKVVLPAASRRDIVPHRGTIESVVNEEFVLAVEDSLGQGAWIDPEGFALAEKKLEKLVDRLERMLADDRIWAFDWTHVEKGFRWVDRERRMYRGTLDASGEARRDVLMCTHRGFETWVRSGERVIVDWKNGEVLNLDRVGRTINVQLAFYSLAFRKRMGGDGSEALFIGALRDLDRPTRPRDSEGNNMPSKLEKQLTPAWLEATGDPTSRKRPQGADGKPIPKWLPERANPAYEEACNRPKGEFFHHCEVNHGLALKGVAGAIKMAEAGIYPANGALTGECSAYGGCPWKVSCLERGSDADRAS
jgi:hypothetical protein